jgi:hypothetical protein
VVLKYSYGRLPQVGGRRFLHRPIDGSLLQHPFSTSHLLSRVKKPLRDAIIGAGGLTSRCFLNETDHNDGILFIRHLSPLKRDLVLRKFRKLKKS